MKRGILITVLLLILTPLAIRAAAKPTFTASLSGAEAVPPVNCPGKGSATFDPSYDDKSMKFKIVLEKVKDVKLVQIHLGLPGKEGLPVVWLFPSEPPALVKQGWFSGTLAEGSITAANLVGPLEGQPLKALVEEVQQGRTYVNIRTKGMPNGELRGQIK